MSGVARSSRGMDRTAMNFSRKWNNPAAYYGLGAMVSLHGRVVYHGHIQNSLYCPFYCKRAHYCTLENTR